MFMGDPLRISPKPSGLIQISRNDFETVAFLRLAVQNLIKAETWETYFLIEQSRFAKNSGQTG